MKILYALILLSFSALPCRAMSKDIIVVPDGDVQVRPNAASAWYPVGRNVKIAAGSEVRTAKDSTAGVYFPDGSRFSLGNSTIFAVDETTKKKAGFQLKLGRLKAAVAGYFASRFEVKTPAAVCAVRGTEFEIDVAKDGVTDMNVTEGLVEVNDSKGAMAVVSSEEKIRVGMDGMSRPEGISLTDERSGEAARPMAVIQDTARERTRTMLEELRNRELKANESQLGKDSIDAFGRRVRLEEYLLRPSDKEFQVLFLSQRAEQHSLNWGQFTEQFNSRIPDDISQVGDIISGMYLSRTAPANWMKHFEFYLTNTVDSVKESIDFTAPTKIDFRGYTGSLTADYRYYPGSIDWKQILSGPGVAAAPGHGTNAPGLNTDERMQFRQTQDWNITTANQFTWTQKVVDQTGALSTLEQITLDPTSLTDIVSGYTSIPVYNVGNPYYDFNTIPSHPSGPGKADFQGVTTYADGSTLSARKMLVSNDGDILGISGAATKNTFHKEGSYNLEEVVGSSLFQGRNIDVLFAPEILNMKDNGTTTADKLNVN